MTLHLSFRAKREIPMMILLTAPAADMSADSLHDTPSHQIHADDHLEVTNTGPAHGTAPTRGLSTCRGGPSCPPCCSLLSGPPRRAAPTEYGQLAAVANLRVVIWESNPFKTASTIYSLVREYPQSMVHVIDLDRGFLTPRGDRNDTCMRS